MTDNDELDLLVIGGGINGAGIARDAAGRGLKVLLAEQDDLAAATSSASSKLIHGGLRYLEHYEFRLVRESLAEREVLLRAAPHIIWPLRFVLPHMSELRPAWMVRLGLLLYDHLGGRELLPGSRAIDLRGHPAGTPLRDGLRKGFVYSDCWVQDARLVVLNCIDAAERGAQVLVRTRCTSARRIDGRWHATLAPTGGAERTVRARALVNAAGPWVSRMLHDVIESGRRQDLRTVKGSHIVVRRLFAHDHAYILQAPDQRVIFAIPFERDFTLIGTTEVDFDGDPRDARISDDEIGYLCAAVNRYFARPTSPEDVVWSYAGVRPLYDDGSVEASVVTRDYVLDLDTAEGEAPLLSVFGGKITTFRRLAERAMEKLAPHLGSMGPAWTSAPPLPGGDIPNADFDAFLAELQARHPWLPDGLAHRLARAYGTRVEAVIGAARGLAGLGARLGGDLYAAEVSYLVRHEWARTAEDILWRRSKLGLHVPPQTADRLAAWLEEHAVDAAASAAQ